MIKQCPKCHQKKGFFGLIGMSREHLGYICSSCSYMKIKSVFSNKKKIKK